MRLYDECIAGLGRLLEPFEACKMKKDVAECSWEDEGKNQMIFQSDTAYELGAGTLPAVSSVMLTDSAGCVHEDEILVYGNDLSQLKADTPFARIALIRVRTDLQGDTNALYQAIRRIEYTRYHLNPKGYMMRISAMNRREAVRIGRDALAEGLDFEKVGNFFLQAYRKHPEVEAVKLIFITLNEFPYAELGALAERTEGITKTLDHLLKKVKMDCNACSLKEICDEVEALYKEETKEK